jgi:hypothetical protein
MKFLITKIMARKSKEIQKVLFDSFIQAGEKIPDKETISFFQKKFGKHGCKNLNPHFQMILNEMNNKGFGKIGQMNHLPKFTKELIYAYKLSQKQIGITPMR